MNAASQAASPELRLGLSRAIRAVGVNIGGGVGLVHKRIEFLTVMHARIGHVILPDQLVPGIRIDVVLVAKEALAVFLGPARILVFLPVLGRILLPLLRRLADLYGLILFAAVALLGHRHDRGINHLAATRNIALRLQMMAMTSIRLRPALLLFSSAGVSTAASISARKLSNGTTRSIISNGSPFAEIAASRLSASKKPSCPIVPKSANREITNQIRMIRQKSPFFEVPYSLQANSKTREGDRHIDRDAQFQYIN